MNIADKLERFFKRFRKKSLSDTNIIDTPNYDCDDDNCSHCKTCNRINKFRHFTTLVPAKPTKCKMTITYFVGGSCCPRRELWPDLIGESSAKTSLVHPSSDNIRSEGKPSVVLSYSSEFIKKDQSPYVPSITSDQFSTDVKSINLHQGLFTKDTCLCRPFHRNIARYQQIVRGFHLLRKLGGGCLGSVYQAYHPTTKQYYALKVFFKNRVSQANRLENVVYENELSRVFKFEFLTSLAIAFQDRHNFYLAFTPYCPGGNLLRYIELFGHFKEDHAKFYVAQIVLALEYLHSIDVIHRDVKPENVVMDSDGFVKLTDFGFCKKLKKKTYTVCGNPLYFAPEIIAGKGYGKEIDWWALGVMLYELIVGRTPFDSPNVAKVYKNITQGKFRTVRVFSAEIRQFLKEILVPDVTKRLGTSGSEAVKSHEFFGSISWEGLLKKKCVPPIVPPPMPDYNRHQSSSLRECDILPTMENDCWKMKCPTTGKIIELNTEEIPDVRRPDSAQKSQQEKHIKKIKSLLSKRQEVVKERVKKDYLYALENNTRKEDQTDRLKKSKSKTFASLRE